MADPPDVDRPSTTVESAQQFIDTVGGSWWGVFAYLLVYLARPIVLFPASVLTVVGGILFGPVSACSSSSSLRTHRRWSPTASVGFSGAAPGSIESTGDDASLRHRWANRMRANSFETVLIMRLVFLPYDLVNYLAGILRLRWLPFLLATALGSLPGTVSFVLLGASLDRVDEGVGGIDPIALGAGAMIFLASLLPGADPPTTTTGAPTKDDLMIGHDPTRTYRAAVIGAGSGGLTLAIGLAGFGHDVVLIEGGRSAETARTSDASRRRRSSTPPAPGSTTRSPGHGRKRDDLGRREDDEMADDERHPPRSGLGVAHQLPQPPCRAGRRRHDDQFVRADHVVIAGGSQPVTIEIDGLDADLVVTNEELFELERAPPTLLIVGGGAIAIEMATAFAALGTRVHIVELQDRLLTSEDPLITEVIERSLRAQGIGLHLGTTIDRFDGPTAHLADGATIEDVDRVLMAVGRRPRLDGLGLDRAGVAATPSGITIDGWGRTSVDGIWAVGDITGTTLTTHGAGAIGRRAVRAIALPKVPKVGRVGAIPNATYGDPEVASVGMSLDALDAIPASSRRRIVVDHADVDRGLHRRHHRRSPRRRRRAVHRTDPAGGDRRARRHRPDRDVHDGDRQRHQPAQDCSGPCTRTPRTPRSSARPLTSSPCRRCRTSHASGSPWHAAGSPVGPAADPRVTRSQISRCEWSGSTTSWPAPIHARIPPMRSPTSVKPRSSRLAAANDEL